MTTMTIGDRGAAATAPNASDNGYKIIPAKISPGTVFAKRAVDLCLAIPAAIISLPLIGLIALMVKWSSPGPVFYQQYRIGRVHDDRTEFFRIKKFRTMIPDPDGTRQGFGECQKDTTRIGNFLRHTKLDELPQLWNVIKGDMSIVGPRPLSAEHYGHFWQHNTDIWARTYELRPGLTGPAEISPTGKKPEERHRSSFRADQFYHNSAAQKSTAQILAYDAMIIYETAKLVFVRLRGR